MAIYGILYTWINPLVEITCGIITMGGKLIEPKVITDFNNMPVAILPTGFYFDDTRWESIWAEYDKKGESLTLQDLIRLFPDDDALQQRSVSRTGSQLAKEFRTKTESD